MRLFGVPWNIRTYILSFFDKDVRWEYEIRTKKFTLEEIDNLMEIQALFPKNILDYEKTLTDDLIKDNRYSFRVMYVQVNANRIGQADAVIEFVKLTPDQEKQLNEQILIKETEKKKYRPGQIVEKMQEEGYITFKMHNHTECWKELSDSKSTLTQYGTLVAGTWYWYDNWINYVREYCEKNFTKS